MKKYFVQWKFCHSKKIYLYSIKVYSIRAFSCKNTSFFNKRKKLNKTLLSGDFR